MNEAIKKAIEERVELGYTEENIIKELVDAGYPKEQAEEMYQNITANNPSSEIPAYSQPETEITPEVTVSESNIEAAKKPKAPKFLLIGFPIIVCFLLWGTAYGGFSSLHKLFSGLFSSAPFETESEMMAGLIKASTETKAYSFTNDFSVTFEPKQPETKYHESAGDMFMLLGGAPSEGHMRINSSGLFDKRDLENPEFDIEFNVNTLLEPYAFNVAGALRLADGAIYGRLDDMPDIFAGFIEIPLQTWILIEETEGGSVIESLPLMGPQLIQSEYGKSPLALAGTQSISFLSSLLGYGVAPEGSTQTATLGQAYGMQTAGMTEEEIEYIKKLAVTIEQYPPISFVGTPQKIKENGETVYRYNFGVSRSGIVNFLYALAPEEEVDNSLGIQVNQSGSNSQSVTCNDSETEYAVAAPLSRGGEGSFCVDSTGFSGTVGYDTLSSATDYSCDTTSFDTYISDGVGLQSARQDGLSAIIKMNLINIRSMAELYYNTNDFSYEGACSSPEVMRLLEALSEDRSAELSWEDVEAAVEELPSQEEFDTFNSLVDMYADFRPDGTFAKLYVGSVFVPGDAIEDSQIRIEFTTGMGRQNDGLDIAVPENVHPQTLDEIMMSPYSSYGGGNDAAIKSTAGNMRSQAEIYYNTNGFSYAGVCQDSSMQQLFQSAVSAAALDGVTTYGPSDSFMLSCNDTPTAYAVSIPYSAGLSNWCVDSTGYAGEAIPNTFSSVSDVTCTSGSDEWNW